LKKILLASAFIFGLVSGVAFGQALIETGKAGVSLNDWGRFRIYTPNTDSTLQLDRLSITIAGDKAFLTDTTGVYDYKKDADTEVGPDTVDSPLHSDYEISGQYNGAYSEAYPNYLITINVYGWVNSNYVIAKYTVTNKETSDINSKIGFELIPMVDGSYGSEMVKYIAEKKTIDFYKTGHVGIKILSHDLTGFNALDYTDYAQLYIEADDDYMPKDSTLWEMLNYTNFDNGLMATGDGFGALASIGSVNIAAGDSVDVYIAVAADSSEAKILAALDEAAQKFEAIGVEEEPNFKPTEFKLAQNYPNPFNPSTRITFNLPEAKDVTLKVFNMLGQEVAALVKGPMSAGEHTVNFNGANLTSGLYIYKISAGNFTAAKKMMLVK
jgi:hypothetical protein